MTKAWDYKSGVLDCSTCEGAGIIDKTPWLHGNDPDRHEVDCMDCDGVGFHECAVCGFNVQIPGHDCIVCETVNDVPLDQATATTPAELALAFGRALRAKSEAAASAEAAT